jgi:peptidoglycan/LPS O-acetylase OafA/YrhL
MSTPARRLLHVDAFKAVAAQAIVLHHLLSYGPLAQAGHAALPLLAGWLQQYGRLAVQIFLVVGGFLSARALSPRGQALAGNIPELLWRRYLRLALPFMAAVGLTLLASALVAQELPELVPQNEVGLAELLGHALLMQDLLGQESLTVGAWYVAIDFQLFACLVGLLWLARRLMRHPRRLVLGPLLVAALCLASAFGLNRLAQLEHFAPYFFAAYGLGALVHWLGHWRHGRVALVALAATVLLANLVEPRVRLVLALATALLLFATHRHHEQGGSLVPQRWSRGLARLGTQSYSLFLVHFPVLLVMNAVAAHLPPLGLGGAMLMLAGTWWLANRLAQPFHRWIEAPAARLDPLAWLPRLRTA